MLAQILTSKRNPAGYLELLDELEFGKSAITIDIIIIKCSYYYYGINKNGQQEEQANLQNQTAYNLSSIKFVI